LYELLSGSLPYAEANSLGELMVSIITADIPLLQDRAPWVPAEIAEIVHRAISRDVAKRYQHAGELRDALARLIPEGPRMTPGDLAAVAPHQRVVVAQRLVVSDDGMLRATARTTAGATRTGETVRKSSNAPAVLAAIAGLLACGGLATAGYLRLRPPAPAAEPAPSAAPVVILSEPAAAPEATPLIVSFELAVGPEGVEVTIDGEKPPIKAGKIAVSGLPGTTRKVVVRLGSEEKEHLVAITHSGLVPSRIELAPKPRATSRPASAGAPRRTGEKKPDKPAGSAPAAAQAPPKATPKVETGTDEFK
jgi:serine/threonine-protein kinase